MFFLPVQELFSENGMKKFADKNRVKQGFRIKLGRVILIEGFYCISIAINYVI